jgi:hypothetical protein
MLVSLSGKSLEIATIEFVLGISPGLCSGRAGGIYLSNTSRVIKAPFSNVTIVSTKFFNVDYPRQEAILIS